MKKLREAAWIPTEYGRKKPSECFFPGLDLFPTHEMITGTEIT